MINRTGKGFTINYSTDFLARHGGDSRLRTAYTLSLDGKELRKYGSIFRICNSVELVIEDGYADKKGKTGYCLTEKDDEGVNTYFVDETTLAVTTIQGELVHFMYDQQRSFANERIKQNDNSEVKSESYIQTRPVGGCCCNHGF